MNIDVDSLKQFLIEAGLVSKGVLEVASKEAKEKGIDLGQFLINEGQISEEDFGYVVSKVMGVPFVDLKDRKIDFAILSMVPEPIARKHNIVAYNMTGDSLEVAMLDPGDLQSIDFIKKKVQLKVLPRLTSKESIKSALIQYQKSLKAEFGDIISREARGIKFSYKKEAEDGDDDPRELKKMAEELPIVRIVDTLINHAILQQASDIHIEPYENEVITRYRIDGILHDAMVLPKNVAPGIVARIKVLSKLRLDEKRLPQDGRFKIETDGLTGINLVSFRVSILPTYFGEKIVMRLLPDTVRGFTLESLGLHGRTLDIIHRALKKTTGMILSTGPTGSGKTTTLYTMIDILNRPDVNISTVEDPIEYQMPRINQTQVRPQIGLSFANGLRSLLRQDPDILMVGEIRDAETAGLAINASLTGHLVLSTLHTNSAAGAIPRLLDMGVQDFLLISTIEVIIGQRLVRKLCEEKERYSLGKKELEQMFPGADLGKVLEILRSENVIGSKDDWGDVSFYKPKKSEKCEDGYSGRMAVQEVLSVSSAIQELILKHSSAEAIGEQARKEGMLTILEDGIFKAASGITSIEEVLRVSNE